MNFHSFFKECVMRFFIIATCIGIASGIVGPVLMPETHLNYTAFFSPPLAALLATLPSFIFYSRKELTLKQVMVRKILHLITLEALLTVVALVCRNISTLGETALFMTMVLIIYAAVSLIGFWLQSKEARLINKGLRKLQEHN
jgi:hypothetical protein